MFITLTRLHSNYIVFSELVTPIYTTHVLNAAGHYIYYTAICLASHYGSGS